MNLKLAASQLLLIATCLYGSTALADAPGVHQDRIVLGQSAAFEGPAMALGLGMRQGLQAAFNAVNELGGVHGRRIELMTLDDGYEPNRAIANTHQLIEKDKVFALIGAVGTPTSKAVQPLIQAAEVPFIGPFTGATFLREPENTNVINVRGTYDQETERWIKYLTENHDITRIAILYQDDSFGRAGLSGAKKALDKRNMTLVAEGTYMRNSNAVKTALLKIRKSKPEAVLLVGAYEPIATFIKLAHKINLKPLFMTLSFVGSNALAAELGSAGEGVLITQVVPSFENTNIDLVKNYRQALNRLDLSAEPGFVSLEGYLVGRLMITALEKIGPSVSRKALTSLFQQAPISLNIDGIELQYGPGDNQGMESVYLSELQPSGTYRYLDDMEQKITSAELP